MRMYRKAVLDPFLLTAAVYISVVFIDRFIYLTYLFIHLLATGPEPVLFRAELAAYVSRKRGYGDT